MTSAHSTTARLERGILRTISWGAVGVAIILLAFLVIRCIHTLTSPSIDLTDLGLVLQGAPVTEEDGSLSHVQQLSRTLSSLTVTDLPLGIRWLIVAELILSSTLGLGLCLAAFLLPRRLLAGSPFARALVWVLFAVTVAVLLSGAVAPFLHAIGESETLRFIADGTMEMTRDTGWAIDGAWIFGMKVNLAPWGVALGMVALLASFEAGTRLQRDTEGLV